VAEDANIVDSSEVSLTPRATPARPTVVNPGEVSLAPPRAPKPSSAAASTIVHPGEVSLTPPGSPSPTVNPPDTPDTIGPHTPSPWERVKNAITAGMPRYSSRTASNPKYGQMQLVSPEEAMTPGEQQRHPVLTGLGEVAGGLTTPVNTAILAASGGLGSLPGAAGRIVPRLIGAGFSAQMLRDAYRQYPEFKAALDRGDESEAWRLGTHIAASTGMGLLSGRQALKSGASPQIASPAEESTVTPPPVRPRPVAETQPTLPVPGLLGPQPLSTPESARTPEGAIRAPASPLSARKLLPPAGAPLPTEEESFLGGKPTSMPNLPGLGRPGVLESIARGAGLRPRTTIVDPSEVTATPSLRSPQPNLRDLAAGVRSTLPRPLALGGSAEAVESAPTLRPRLSLPTPAAEPAAIPKLSKLSLPQPQIEVAPRAQASAEGPSAEMQRAANLAFGQLKRNPIEQQYARDTWSAMQGGERSPEPPQGMPLARARFIQSKLAGIRSGESLPSALNPDPRASNQFAPDELEAAHQRLVEASGMLEQATRPGRYEAVEESGEKGQGWYGVKSLRTMFPWFADMKESPAELRRAIERQQGPAYNRLLQSASEYEQSSREATRSILRDVAPDLDQLVGQVKGMDPELAQILTDASSGKLGVFDGSIDQVRQWAERHIADAKQLTALSSSIDELAEAEHAEHAGTGGAPEGPRTAGQSRPGEGVFPGFESAVAEQRRGAAERQGEKLTEQINRPPESIEAAAGEMETKSPLFRGTEASPQRELLPPRESQMSEAVAPRAKTKVAKGSAREALLREAYKPGNVVKSYLGYDKVLQFSEGDPSKPYPGNSWRVQVIGSDKEGNPLSGEKPRWHATPPEKVDLAAAQQRLTSERASALEGSELFGKASRQSAGVDPTMLREGARIAQQAWQRNIAEPFIDRVLKIGDKYQKVRAVDPAVATGLHLLDNAPQYLRQKAAQNVHDIIGGLSREQERLFTLLADADSRENLRANHPGEYRQALGDPAIQEALRKYQPIERELTATRARLGGDVLDQDYLRRIYEKYVPGVGKEQAPGSAERATSGFDRVIRPQRIGSMSREATAEYHYEKGLHEFGPAFATKFIGTNLGSLRDTVAKDFLSKATQLQAGAPEPRSIEYGGETYYRPDIAADMGRGAKPYDRYDPTAGEKFPQPADGKFLGPREVVRALNDYGRREENEPSGLRRWFQEQVIGFGFGIPHVANIMRRVSQNVEGGALNPKGWADAWKVAFNKELRERGIKGLDDPTFDMLARQGAISTGEMSQLKEYWGGNLNPANWTRKLAEAGHKLLYEPGAVGGLGGIDQRARMHIADLMHSQRPELTEEQIGRGVRDALGDYNRANWSDRQKMLARFMLFPGWDFSSVRWMLQHPLRTTVPPAVLVLLANQALNKAGANRAEDARDIQNIHIGDRTIGPGMLREPMARNLFRPLINYAQAKIQGSNEQRAQAAAARGMTEGAGGLLGMLRPDLSGLVAIATNRQGVFSSKEIVGEKDWSAPGKILPSLALEKQAVFTIRHAVPALDRMLDSKEDVDVRGFMGGNVGLPNYREDAETRLARNAADAQQVFQMLSKVAKENPAKAREMMRDPDNAAYALFHRDFQSITAAKGRLDQARERIEEAKMPETDKQNRLRALDASRQTLLGHAEALNNLLFQRRQKGAEVKPAAIPTSTLRLPQPLGLGGNKPAPELSTKPLGRSALIRSGFNKANGIG
jgi:hypothetical protein